MNRNLHSFVLFTLLVMVGMVFSCTRKEIIPDSYIPNTDEAGEQLPVFSTFFLDANLNKGLTENFYCHVEGNRIDAFCQSLKDVSSLVVSFDTDAWNEVTVDGVEQLSGRTANDFNRVVNYTLTSYEGVQHTYEVRIVGGNNVPRFDVWTENFVPVNGTGDKSSQKYVRATFRYSNDPDNGPVEATGKIRVRGNASASPDKPKKPYKVKFDEKQSLSCFPANRDWVFLSDNSDKSLMRTAYMQEMSYLVDLPYPVRYRIVDFYLNNDYRGTYYLTDQIERANSRVNIEKDGFIIEDDLYAGEEPVNFSTKYFTFSFKYPDPDDGEIVRGDDNYNFIVNFMKSMENALFSDNFADPEKGYRKYLDARAFAKYFVLNEVTGNVDPNRYYVLPSRTGKLTMGPEWDSEWSLGAAHPGPHYAGWDLYANPEDMITYEFWPHVRYFQWLMKDPYFRGLVKEEWAAVKPMIPLYEERMHDIADSIFYTQYDNFNRWPIMDQQVSVAMSALLKLGSWPAHVYYCEDFFRRRVEWFDAYVESL